MTLGTGDNKKVNKIQKGSSEHLQLTEEAKCMYNQIADWLSELMEREGDTGVKKKEREVMHNCPQGTSVMGPLRAFILAVIFPCNFYFMSLRDPPPHPIQVLFKCHHPGEAFSEYPYLQLLPSHIFVLHT